MPYTTTTLAELRPRLTDRWEQTPFWSEEEARLGLNEALLVWNLFTATWKTRVTLPLSLASHWISLPAAISWAARVECNQVPLEQAGLFGLDQGHASWEGESSFPTHWAPAGVNLIAIWPSLAAGVGSLIVDGLMRTPRLFLESDTVDISETEERHLLGYAVHYCAFKEGGQRFASTLPFLQEFVQACADKNDRLSTSSFFREAMGYDSDKMLRPIRRQGGSTQPAPPPQA